MLLVAAMTIFADSLAIARSASERKRRTEDPWAYLLPVLTDRLSAICGRGRLGVDGGGWFGTS